ncbi:Hypothetical protein A7982_00744 [Minicystis rosea]|nr:Hypothetical protein A7982_00744 [Minicystis rosea]
MQRAGLHLRDARAATATISRCTVCAAGERPAPRATRTNGATSLAGPVHLDAGPR